MGEGRRRRPGGGRTRPPPDLIPHLLRMHCGPTPLPPPPRPYARILHSLYMHTGLPQRCRSDHTLTKTLRHYIPSSNHPAPSIVTPVSTF